MHRKGSKGKGHLQIPSPHKALKIEKNTRNLQLDIATSKKTSDGENSPSNAGLQSFTIKGSKKPGLIVEQIERRGRNRYNKRKPIASPG
jgi:hypothetical protein